jgi:hypothetical protein
LIKDLTEEVETLRVREQKGLSEELDRLKEELKTQVLTNESLSGELETQKAEYMELTDKKVNLDANKDELY